MKVLVVDNEINVREGLVLAIKTFCPQIEDVKEADSIESGLKMISTYEPELVFLDVELGSGTGMDLLSQIPKVNFHVIFITAHNKYAIDAFKYSAIDFLLKPINPEELIRSVNKVVIKNNNDNLLKQLTVLRSEYTNNTIEKNIVLNEHDSIHVVKSNNIIYCSSEGNYTTFFTTTSEKQIVISKNMKVFEEMLVPLGFMRVHNSYLVNLNKIEKYDKGDGGFLIVTNGSKIPVSQRKKEQLMNLFKSM